jgi:hypothetical protein
MDDIVKQAMAKWPNVPHVYGWLSLDRRGVWRIKGDAVTNEVIAGFISRNYANDDDGRWFFQNGPQRVFVELAYTPMVYGVPDYPQSNAILTHTRKSVQTVHAAWIDDEGTLLLETEHGVGHVHDQDLEWLLPSFVGADGGPLDEDSLEARLDGYAAGAVESEDGALWFQQAATRVKIGVIRARDVPAHFGFVNKPE